MELQLVAELNLRVNFVCDDFSGTSAKIGNPEKKSNQFNTERTNDLNDPTRAEGDVSVTVATGVTQTVVPGREQDTGEAH